MDTHDAPSPEQLPDVPPNPRPVRRWRGAIAGAVAGGVLATSVAVPVTWAVTNAEPAVTSPGSSTTNSGFTPSAGHPGYDSLPQGGAQPGYGSLPQGGTQPGYGGLPQGGTSTDTGATTEPDATDAQSQGVALVDTTLTNGEAAGTGLVIDPSGLVLTNYHVVEGSTSITVTIAADGTTYDAEVVGHDQSADVALLQLDGASGLSTVALDTNGDPAVTDTVTAVGNADGQGYLSASKGTVVALDQSITTASSGGATGEDLSGLIETNASVVGGYSGGALLDNQGEVVGITTAASSGGPTQSYAVPIDDALSVAQQIESGTETAEVQIGPSAYLGIGVASAGNGVQVGTVEDGGPAAGAGIVAGDTVTALGGKSVTSLDGLRSALATHRPGDRVTVRWTDGAGHVHHATVTLDDSPVN
jgi:S1-C subfamily serine protease